MHVTQLRDHIDEIRSAGADVAAIGMGTEAQAAHFKDSQEIPFVLLVDRRKETYRALNLKRANLWEIVGPGVWVRFGKALLQGKPSGKPRQDAYQLGGTMVVKPGGEIAFMHRSKDPADDYPVEKILSHL